MSQIVHKMKKVLSGCMHKSSNYKYTENDMSNPILDFESFESSPEMPARRKPVEFTIYNDYDNLNHTKISKNTLKDTTNIKKEKSSGGGLKRRFLKNSSNKNLIDNENMNSENFNYSHIYESKSKISTLESTKSMSQSIEGIYCEIETDETETLIDLDQLKIKSEPPVKKLATSENKQLSCELENQQNELEKECKSLTDLRSPESFVSLCEGFHWYLNLLNETIVERIQADKTLNEANRSKRLGIAKAHLLYARNFYEMKISPSTSLKQKLADIHPCLVVMAVLLDSEAVRLEESHVCVCDSYIYLFSTRLKYCAWKSKLFILLKKPKRSSFDRLNLIEDLTKCHKIIQEKPWRTWKLSFV